MSKVSKKSAPSASKPAVLSKVKGASVSKPAQSAKAKSKEVAKEIAAKSQKKDKKNKKVPVKEPTPEPESESEEEEDESEESSEDESESEAKGKNNASEDEAPKVNGSAPKAAVAAPESEEEDSEDSDDEESEAEIKPATNGAAKAAAATEDDSEDDSSEESDSDEETPAEKANGAKVNGNAESESEEDASDDSDDSDEEEAEAEVKPTKRKAEDTFEPVAKKTKADVEDRGSNLFVGNLSWNVDEEWLKSEFEEFGEINGVRLITNRDDGRSKGFGYVEFVNSADAAKAYDAKKGSELDGRPMNIDFANQRKEQNPREKQENRNQRFGDQISEPSETLFLGNLSFEVTEDDIQSIFAPFGTPTSIRIPTHPEDGTVKGFGYITFSSVDEATAGLEGAQGSYIKNRAVRIDYASARPKNNDSPRGGRGGFGGGFGGGRGNSRGRGGFGGRGDFGGRGGRGGGRGRGAPRGGRGGTTNRGGFGDFSGTKVTF